MRRGSIAAGIVGLAVIAPPAAHAQGAACPVRDVRDMLGEAGQGMNGGVVEMHPDRLVIEAESRHEPRSIAFGEHVTVHGRNLPAELRGRIGIVVRRRGGRWHATRCDVVPAARMALALAGRDPCPAPGVRIARATVEGRGVELRLALRGDVTGLRLRWGRAVRRRALAPGFTMLTEHLRFARPGRRVIRVQVLGGSGPGCGTARRSSATARRTVRID